MLLYCSYGNRPVHLYHPVVVLLASYTKGSGFDPIAIIHHKNSKIFIITKTPNRLRNEVETTSKNSRHFLDMSNKPYTTEKAQCINALSTNLMFVDPCIII